MTRVEVCIVSYDSQGHIAAAIESVVHHIPGAAIAVREHGPLGTGAEDAAAAATRLAVPLRIDDDRTNVGFGAGCNALAATSSADWLLFLNPDAAITAWPWPTTPPETGCIYGPLISGNGPADRHFGRSYRVRDEILRSWFRRGGKEPEGRGFVSGAAMLVARPDFERIGGFDTNYFLYYEDIDLCTRANAAGIGTRIHNGWRVHHEGMHSTRQQRGVALIRSYESALRFHRSRGERLATYRAYVIVDASLRWMRAALRRNGADRSAYVELIRRVIGGPSPSAPHRRP